VASLIAGLGIGGLALALAAQKTVENLFGSVSVSVDQPCRVGDFVRVEGGLLGTVENIGLRSTRIRTLDRTIVTIPNGKFADARIETFAARDKVRLFTVVQLEYRTTAEQMRSVLAGFEQVLSRHPKIEPNSVVVRFAALGASSLDVEVVGIFLTSDWNEFTRIRQELFLELMEVVERAGTGFAFPTQTLHLASVPPGLTLGASNR
jgi:MscS family membrane protein